MSRRNSVVHGVLALVFGLGVMSVAMAAQAENRWEAKHPRRDQVLDRIQNLQRRIHQERLEGTMSPARARALRAQTNRVRAEEQAMARRNGGYITPAQQATLNRQEDRISQKVGESSAPDVHGR